MTTVVKDIVSWLMQWYYTEDEIDIMLSNKLNSNLTEANRIVKTDGSGNVTVGSALSNYENPTIVDNLTTNDATKVLSAKQGKVLQDNKLEKVHSSYKGKNVVTNSSTGAIEFEDKPTIPSASSSTPSADSSSGAVGTGTTWARADHQHPISSIYATSGHNHSGVYAPVSHTQATSTITNGETYSNLGSNLTTQKLINDAINTKIGELSSINAINIVDTMPTADATTMGKLYIIAENNKVNVYYTEDNGASATTRYTWHKMDADILDSLNITWSMIDSSTIPSSFTPSAHTHNTSDVTLTSVQVQALTNIADQHTSDQSDINSSINSWIGNLDSGKSNKTATLGTTITLVDKGETNEGCIIFNTIS